MLKLCFSLKQGLIQLNLRRRLTPAPSPPLPRPPRPLHTRKLSITWPQTVSDSIPNVQVKGLRSTMPLLEAVKAETESSSQGERGDRKTERMRECNRGGETSGKLWACRNSCSSFYVRGECGEDTCPNNSCWRESIATIVFCVCVCV